MTNPKKSGDEPEKTGTVRGVTDRLSLPTTRTLGTFILPPFHNLVALGITLVLRRQIRSPKFRAVSGTCGLLDAEL